MMSKTLNFNNTFGDDRKTKYMHQITYTDIVVPQQKWSLVKSCQLMIFRFFNVIKNFATNFSEFVIIFSIRINSNKLILITNNFVPCFINF